MRLRQKPAVALSLWPKKPSWKIIGTWGDCWNCSNPRLAFHLSGLLQRFDGSSPTSAGLAPRAGRCEYCRFPARLTRVPFQIDHIIAEKHGGRTTFENLALSWFFCNT